VSESVIHLDHFNVRGYCAMSSDKVNLKFARLGARHSAVVKNVKSNWRATLKLPQDHPFVSRSKYNTMLSTYVSAPSPINKQTSSLVLYLKSPKSYK
jgi:hypothetical protein